MRNNNEINISSTQFKIYVCVSKQHFKVTLDKYLRKLLYPEQFFLNTVTTIISACLHSAESDLHFFALTNLNQSLWKITDKMCEQFPLLWFLWDIDLLIFRQFFFLALSSLPSFISTKYLQSLLSARRSCQCQNSTGQQFTGISCYISSPLNLADSRAIPPFHQCRKVCTSLLIFTIAMLFNFPFNSLFDIFHELFYFKKLKIYQWHVVKFIKWHK